MTKPTTHTFGEFLVLVESADSPGVFLAPCGLTTKGFNQTANMQETIVPDCDDPDAPAYVERAVQSLSSEIPGDGILAEEAFPVWQGWFDSAASRRVQIYPMGQSGGFYSGSFLLSQFNATVARGEKVKAQITLVSDGQWIWEDIA
jgi:hypothetical protein